MITDYDLGYVMFHTRGKSWDTPHDYLLRGCRALGTSGFESGSNGLTKGSQLGKLKTWDRWEWWH
jgi:hypothetical protein